MIRWMGKKIGGSLKNNPEDMAALSPTAKRLVRQVMTGLDPKHILDYHTHVVGFGSGGTGCCVQEHHLDSPSYVKKLTAHIMIQASGVTARETADQDYVNRLVRLTRSIEGHGRYCILAFDKFYRKDGTPDMAHTEFFTPTEYVYELARKYPDVFVPSCSIHPYRADAIAELEKWHAHGIRLIKWLPNSMGIDPSDRRCFAYYDKCRELNMIILCHTGEERAVEAYEYQALGNPLLLRAALDRGVTVIMAHCASLGTNEDLDHAGPIRPQVSNFELFLRMMDEKRYEGQLFGDLSAICQFNRMDCVPVLLKRTDLHHRLVNGSDYPLPMIGLLIMTRPFVKVKLISQEERAALNEIFTYNPLLYDFALKRTLRGPENQRFPDSCFMMHPQLDVISHWESTSHAEILHLQAPFFAEDNGLEFDGPESVCGADHDHTAEREVASLDECKARLRELGDQVQALQSVLREKEDEYLALHMYTLQNYGTDALGPVDGEEWDLNPFAMPARQDSLERLPSIRPRGPMTSTDISSRAVEAAGSANASPSPGRAPSSYGDSDGASDDSSEPSSRRKGLTASVTSFIGNLSRRNKPKRGTKE